MIDKLSSEEILNLLRLEANATCGFVRLTFVSKQLLAANVLPSPFSEARPVGSALYFMVTPSAPVRLHRIRSDQLYHYYLGDPLGGKVKGGAPVPQNGPCCASPSDAWGPYNGAGLVSAKPPPMRASPVAIWDQSAPQRVVAQTSACL